MLARFAVLILSIAPAFAQPLALHVFSKNGKQGFMDAEGTVRIPAQFDGLEAFSEGLAAAAIIQGTEPFEAANASGTCRIEALRWGFIDATGRVVIPHRYRRVGKFSEGKAAASLDGEWGYIDRTGKWSIKPPLPEWLGEFHDGLAVFRDSNGKYGFINASGRPAFPLTFDWADHFEGGVAVVWTSDGAALIDKTGRVIAKKKSITRAGPASFIWSDTAYDGLQGLMSPDGKVISPAVFQVIHKFSNSVATAYKDRRWMLINDKGATVKSFGREFTSIGEMGDGLAPACLIAGDEERCGYMDSTGTLVISPRFGRADSFANGVASVRDAVFDEAMEINRRGKVLLRPSWDDRPNLKTSGDCRFPPPAPPPPPRDYSLEVSINTQPAGAAVYLVPLYDWQTHQEGKQLLQNPDALSAYQVPRGVTPFPHLRLKAQVYMGVFEIAQKRKVSKIVVSKESLQFAVNF